jgi:hypothetical protein
VHGVALEEVLYHKSEGEGIAKVISFDVAAGVAEESNPH